ncbi:unnamed protein product [Litomosoides sigmodontis]|uniref:Uncharacterized protein n=1 Tax=Litomosoides sigmodontis TaxID=42156 RepID=A0A3P6SRA2_LITSI|nr:unnamed protein product [Litomosoides sigmodontis]
MSSSDNGLKVQLTLEDYPKSRNVAVKLPTIVHTDAYTNGRLIEISNARRDMWLKGHPSWGYRQPRSRWY